MLASKDFFLFTGPSSSLVAFADDAMEGEVDDDDEGTVETDEGTQDEGEQAVTETEQVIIFINR